MKKMYRLLSKCDSNGLRWCRFILVIVTCLFSVSFAKSDYDAIAVGLSYGSKAVDSFTISAPSGLIISNIGKLKGEITVSKKRDNKLTFESDSKTKTIDAEDGITVKVIEDDEFIKYNGIEYRGELVLYRFSDSDITVINKLDLEEYLYGVVPKEMATGHPIEALKAQAVAARTYACDSMGKYSKWKFDVTDTTSDQAYGGVNAEKSDTTKAIKETNGEVMTYDGEIAFTPFFSTSAGFTEASENVWNVALPYLVAVNDKYQPKDAAYTSWNVTYTKEEIEELTKNKKIGEVVSVRVAKETPSNAVLKLEIVGTNDTYTIEKEKARTFFNLRSQFYDVITNNMVSVIGADGEVEKKSLTEVLYAVKDKAKKFSTKLDEVVVKGIKKEKEYSLICDEYIFAGSGWGHGVGMSQTGAIGMAKEGFTYDEILKWYYTDIEIEKM